MTSNLRFDMSVDKDKKTITTIREFAADRATIWDAFTDAEFLDKWWAPKPWLSKTKSMDFKKGGKRIYAMVGPNGEEHWAIFDYQEIDKPNYFSGIDGFSDAQGVINPQMPRTNWKVTFKDSGSNTLVEVLMTFSNLKDMETLLQMGFKEGFTIALEGLDAVLATKK